LSKLFSQFSIDERIVIKLAEKKITIPTQIQEEVIPSALRGKDVIAQSRTGSGKTISYLVPVIDFFYKKKIRTIIIAPTNELAKQIYMEAISLSDNINIVLASGGDNIDSQLNSIKSGVDILIGVPGRIIKLIETGSLKTGIFKKIVLDEVDFMIDLGFNKELEKIFELSKNIDQYMVFSATMSQKTKKALDLMNNQRIAIRPDAKNHIPENIKNYFVPIAEDQERIQVLIDLVSSINPYLSIIFVRTRDEVDWVFNKLKEKGVDLIKLSGELPPQVRKRNLKLFKEAKVQYLISTDLASRGLDVEAITHIINYNLPYNSIDFVHRAGRTGRMEKSGEVYSICNELDEGYLKKYAFELGFTPIACKIENSQVLENPLHKGVKARFNLNEIKKNKETTKRKISEHEKSEAKNARKGRSPRKR